MKIKLIYPFNTGFEITKEVEFDETNFHIMYEKYLNLDKFYNDYFTEEEIDRTASPCEQTRASRVLQNKSK